MSTAWNIANTARLYGRLASTIGTRSAARWRSSRREDAMLSTPLSTFPLLARGASSDRDVFYQIFVEREYSCIDHLNNVGLIVDAGANVGYSSAYLLTRFPNARVIALEPDAGNFAALKRNLAPWRERAICLQMALWSEVTTLDFRADTIGQGDEWGRRVEASDLGCVEATTIPVLLDTYGPIDLLKVDIEGAEKEVFRSAPWMSQVENVVIELHSDEDRDVFLNAATGFALSECGELTVALRQA